MAEYLVKNSNGDIYVVRNWLNDSNKLYFDVKNFLLELERIRSGYVTVKIRGRNYKIPRKVFIVADKGVSHSFGGVQFPIYPWPDILIPIKNKIAEETGINFNSCTINWYVDGNDFIKDHHDSGVKSPNNAVLTVSLGVSRTLNIKGQSKFSTIVNSGDVFVMTGNTNYIWTHGIPKENINSFHGETGRISLTFRDL